VIAFSSSTLRENYENRNVTIVTLNSVTMLPNNSRPDRGLQCPSPNGAPHYCLHFWQALASAMLTRSCE